MAAASRLDRSASLALSFSAGAAFSSDNGFSVTTGFSLAVVLALVDDFSLLAAFVFDVDLSVFDALLPDDDFPVLGAFAVDGLSVVEVFGFVATFPFDGVPLLVDGVVFGDEVFSFTAGAETFVESSTDLGAVSGFTAGAHALAMTIAISGIRA